MEIKIVTGRAGAGKSHLCIQLRRKGYHIISHDLWVASEYECERCNCATFIKDLFGLEVVIDNKIDKKLLAEKLIANPTLNNVVKGFFIAKFLAYIVDMINKGFLPKKTVIEVPYLEDSIKFLKEKYGARVILVDAPLEVIKPRLVARGWSDQRIFQSLMFGKKSFDISIADEIYEPVKQNG